jgi:hypothetical protein
MAIADDFTVAVNGDIRADSPAATYTVLELHRWLQDLADQAEASGDDLVDITSPTPSVRSTDQIIALQGTYNIDDATAEYFYGGSISQDNGDTLYGGLRVLGTVNSSDTQLQVIQDGALYDTDAPFWGTQASPFNGGGNVLFRCLVKCRENGHDIDAKRIRVRAGHMHTTGGDTFASFDVTLGLAEAVAAISTVDDPQNTTALATIGAWAGGDIPTNTEGYQVIDINDGNGDQPYYSKWTFNTNSLGMKSLWEWAKYITRVGSASTWYGLDGDLVQGITHEISYDNQSGTFQEDEYVVWGTGVTYDTLTGGTFTEGNYIVFANGAAGKILYDNGTTFMIVALESVPSTIVDTEVMTEYTHGAHGTAGTASGVTAAVDTSTPVADNDKNGGEGWVLAYNDTTDDIWIQLMSGAAIEDNVPLRGLTSGATADAQGAAVARTVSPVFLGSYTGSLIGAYGVGVDPDDLSSGDTVRDLTNTVRNAPNNVTFTITNLISGEHYVLVMKKDTGNDFDFSEMQLATALTGAETNVDVGTGNVPADAAQTGTLRITLNSGLVRKVPYTAHDGDDGFTISADFTSDNAAISNGVSLAFIDKLATGSSELFTLKYNADRTLWLRARSGSTGNTLLQTWEQQGNLTDVGGGAIAGQISDA